MDFTPQETLRYARHITLPEVGWAGQRRLKAARILLVGAGGLGSPTAMYLAAAGVGTLGIIDFDIVDETNLQRQILHGTDDIGRPKLDSAIDTVRRLNPHVTVEPHRVRLTSDNALEIFAQYDLVIDGTDNFPTRYLINDACVLLGKPWVYGSILRFEGQNSVFSPGTGPCYRCLFAEPPPPGMVPSCAEGGVLGVLPGLVGSVQATEALKLVLGVGESLVGRLLIFDALRMSFREVRFRRDPECPVCGDSPTVRELIDYERFCGLTSVEDEMSEIPEITAAELKQRLDAGAKINIIDVREQDEWEIGNLEGYGAKLIPLGEIPESADEIDRNAETVLMCRTGGRSGRALEYLRDQGFDKLLNLKGGIHAWADEVDASIPKY